MSTTCLSHSDQKISTRERGLLVLPKYLGERCVLSFCNFFFAPFSLSLTSHQAGGKEDGAQGVGVNTDKVKEALEVAQNYLVNGKA